MTKDEHDQPLSNGLKRALIVGATFIVATFLFGVVFGFSQSVAERGNASGTDIAILGGLAVALCLTLFFAWKVWPRTQPGQEAPSTSKARSILLQLFIAGIVLGVVFALAGDDAPDMVFSNGPIAPLWAGVMLLVWLVFVPAMSWKWWQTVDEHEATAYREGGFWAAHLYMFLVPAWWVAERAGWLPEQEPMVVFLIVCFFWSGWWLYKRYF